MRYTIPWNRTTAGDRRSRYLFGALKVVAVLLTAAGLTAGKCGGNCCIPGGVCEATTRVRIELFHQGKPVQDLIPDSKVKLFIGNANQTKTFLSNGLLTFVPGSNAAEVNLDSPIPRTNIIDTATKAVRVPPDASFATFDDKLCASEFCGALNKRFRYILLLPPRIDYNASNCLLILKYDTKRICDVCP